MADKINKATAKASAAPAAAADAAAAKADEKTSAGADEASSSGAANDDVNVEEADGASATQNEQSEEGDEKDGEEQAADPEPAEGNQQSAAVAGPSTPAKPMGPTELPHKSAKGKSAKKGTPGTKGKPYAKKNAKTRILNLNAQPGDHYFVRLKGYPKWPGIICDEEMLPEMLIRTRPVTAMRPDGTYREDFADGGKRVAERTYPVMYLETNEFGWVPNTDLEKLDPAEIASIKLDRMRKALQGAHQLAAENHDLDFYKAELEAHREALAIQAELKAEAELAKLNKTPKGKKAADADGDVSMGDEDDEDAEVAPKKSAKKRKAEDSAETPSRSDSVKKPKIKLTTSSSTPKANGSSSTPKSAKAGTPAREKIKIKKLVKVGEKSEASPAPSKDAELSAEEKHARKEKEVLFLRHKLQKGLLTRDQVPKEEDMKNMSDFIAKLEGMPELEVSIIRATKINKVLRAVLKLDDIPRDEELKFKQRSAALLEKWTKLLAAADGGAAAPESAANGVNGGMDKLTLQEKESKEEAVKTEGEGEAAEKKDAGEGEKAEEETKAPEAAEAST